MAAVAILALLVGGFSEAASTHLVAAAGIFFGVALSGAFRQHPWARKSLGISGVALAFALVALTLEIVSPANAGRLFQAYGSPTPLAQLPGQVLRNTYYFVRVTTNAEALPFALIFGFSLGLAYLSGERSEGRGFSFRSAVGAAALLGLAAGLLVAASLTPSLYVQGALPASRGEIIPRFTLIAACASIAWITGIYLRQRFRVKWAVWAASLLICLTYVFGAISITHTASRISIYANRAAIWDERDAMVRHLANEGVEVIEVRAIDGVPVGGLHDLKPNAGHWVNRCAAHYYGVKALRGSE